MPKIESLTKAQQAKFPEYIKRWTDIGLSTQPADRPRAEAAIRKMYECGGLKAPKRIVWCGSPLSQGLTREAVNKIASTLAGPNKKASVWASVGDSVRDSVYGQHDANWLSFYKFFEAECGLEAQTEKLAGLWELCESAGWALPHENICWVSERHCTCNRDERGRLHCLTGPALAYADGFSIYAVHGVRLSMDIIENPKSIDIPRIEKEANAEIRRVMIERYGQSKYIVDSGAQEIACDDFGTLYRKELAGDEPILMVKVINSSAEPDGSYREYFLRVHPECRPMLEGNRFGDVQTLTPLNAIASTFGKMGSEYVLEAQT